MNKINKLLQGAQEGKLYFSSWLEKNGYSAQLVKSYRDSKWLTALAPGVMYRTGSKLNAVGALSCYNEQLGKHFHIAAHSALEMENCMHYVPMGKPNMMVRHPKGEAVPKWLTETELDYNLRFFTLDIFDEEQIESFNENGFQISISSREQAFMECLALAPNKYFIMDLYYLMEQLGSIRPKVVQRLLEGCKNYKVKRLFLYMAEKAGHIWYKELELDRIDLGTGKYALVKGGMSSVYIPKYKITIPEELHEYR